MKILSKISLAFIFMLISFWKGWALLYPVFSFEFPARFPVVKGYPNPWAGGLNAVNFVQLGLEAGHTKDLFLWDKIGEVGLCFTENGDYAPEFLPALPPIQSWVQGYDYNHDGKLDLFTYNGVSGIRVYKNVSQEQLRFEMVEPALPAKMFDKEVPIYCTSVDYPALVDVDGDGDMDVLNFWVPTTGDFLHYYRNYAYEKWGRSDTFLLEIEDWSWGCFVESEESNQIFLDSCSPHQTASIQFLPKHTGSTIRPVYSSQRGVYDLMIGDQGFPSMVYLKNGGSREQARIVDYDTLFPEREPMILYDFPAVSLFESGDSTYYVASPFSSDAFNTQGENSLWRYFLEEAGEEIPEAVLMEKDFLQSGMMDFGTGAYPILYDYNQDGLMDIIVGNYGECDSSYEYFGSWKIEQRSSLALLENVGTAQEPQFLLKTRDLWGFKEKYGHLLALYPAIGDFDKDGVEEMILGNAGESLLYFRLERQGDSLCPHLKTEKFGEIQTGGFSSPTLFDLDGDGYLDLIVGEKRRVWNTSSGRISKAGLTYFRYEPSLATSEFPFVKVTDSLGRVDVIDRTFSNFGYSRPCFVRDDQGNAFLFCGGENGRVYLYSGVNGAPDTEFQFEDYLYYWRQEDYITRNVCGWHAAPAVYDFNQDGYWDLVLGNQRGGLQYFQGIAPKISNERLFSGQVQSDKIFSFYPNPVASTLYVKMNASPKDGREKVFFYNARLECVQSFWVMEDGFQLDLRNLSSGMYFLKIGSQVEKIIKR